MGGAWAISIYAFVYNFLYIRVNIYYSFLIYQSIIIINKTSLSTRNWWPFHLYLNFTAVSTASYMLQLGLFKEYNHKTSGIRQLRSHVLGFLFVPPNQKEYYWLNDKGH